MLNGFFTIKEAAYMLGVCKNSLRNWERLGKMQVKRNSINNYRLYSKDDITQLYFMIYDKMPDESLFKECE